MFGSKGAIPDPNAVTINDYAWDVRVWVAEIKRRSNAKCIWVLGHSEGGLIALAAMQQPENICGVILVAAPGRRMGTILRDQLKANRANAPILKDAMAAIEALEAGKTVDVTAMHPALLGLFAPQVQPFLIDMMAKNPTALAAKVTKPMLIIGGERDIQVPAADARALAVAQPKASLTVIPKMNHVLKDVEGDSPADNLKTYSDPSLPVNRTLVETIAAFVKA
jgi:pimeloyl-ACP methyl ester carboxylesterase